MVDIKKQKSVFKSSVSYIFIISTILLSVYLVFGTPTAYFDYQGQNVTHITFVEDNYTQLNISINGSTLTTREINITVPLNFVLSNLSRNQSDVLHDFNNTTTSTGNVFTFNGTNLSANDSIDYFGVNISAPIPGNYTINITMRTGTVGTDENVSNSSINITVNDTESSDIFVGVVTEANDTALNRTFIYINVSANQTNEDSITFELHNNDGIVRRNTTTNASRFINWSGLGDGNYSYNVTINDTWGNSNTTDARYIFLDGTKPTVSVSCTAADNAYTENDVISCSCSIGDAVNATPTKTENAVSTATTGTFTYTCTVRDGVPNNATASLTYTVAAYAGGSAVSGGGASSITKTVTISDGDFKSGTTKALATNERFKFSVDSKNHFATIKELTSQTVKIEIASSHPQTATLQIGDTRKFDVTSNGYYDLSVKLNSISGNKADLTIKSINEFITVEVEEEQQESDEQAEKVQAETVITDLEAFGNLTWLWIIIIILVIIGIVVFFIVLNSRKNK